MKIKSKVTLILIWFIGALCLLFGFTACKEQMMEIVLSGFTPAESITVDKGAYVSVENLYVVDQDGDVYKVNVSVKDSTQTGISLSNNGFFADDVDGYTILYTVNTQSGVQTKTTTVYVTENKSENFQIPYDALLDVGNVYTLPISDELKSEYSFSATVTSKEGGATVQVDETLSFTLPQIGYYEIAVTGTDAQNVSKTDTFEVYAREAMKDGELETFASDFNVVNQLDGRYDRRIAEGWSLIDTTGTTVKNRFDEDDTLLSITTDKNWVEFYFLPRANEAYYESLVDEGYEYISVWLRIDSNIRHKVQRRNGDGRFYWSYVEDSMPNEWMEVRFNLLPEQPEDWTGSFLYFFDEYNTQSLASIVIDNSEEYNPYGGGDMMKIYIDDVFAVKKVDLTVDETFGANLKVGDTVDFSGLAAGHDELEYTLSFRGEDTLINGSEYTFRANGEYTVTASVLRTQQNLSGSVRKKLTVADINDFLGTSLIEERVGATKAVSLQNLNVSLDGVTCETINYTVSRYGEPVSVNDTSFIADKDGCYTVNVACKYTQSGEAYYSYNDLTVDVWSEESKNQVFAVTDYTDNVLGWSHYMNSSWEKLPVFSTVEDTQIGGETGNYLRVQSNGGQWTCISVRPYYSKHYYEQLASNTTHYEYSVSYSYALIDESGEYSTRKLLTYTRPYQEKAPCGEWTSIVWTMSDFFEYYDYLTAHYKYIQDYIASGKVQYMEKNANAKALLAVENAQNGVSKRELSVYLTDITVKCEERIETYALPIDIYSEIDVSKYVPENTTGTITYSVTETASGDTATLSTTTWSVSDLEGNYELHILEDGVRIKTVRFELFENEATLATNVTDFMVTDFATAWSNGYANYWDNANHAVKESVTVGGVTGTFAYFESQANTTSGGNANNFILPVNLTEAQLTYYAEQGYGLSFEIYGDILNWGNGGSINVQMPKYENGEFTWSTYAITQKGWTTLTIDILSYMKAWESYEANGLNYTQFACLLMRPYNGLNGVANGGHGATAFYIGAPYLLKIVPQVGEQADGTIKMTDYEVASFKYEWSNSYTNHWANVGTESVDYTTIGGKTGYFASFSAGENSNNTSYNSCFIGSHLTKEQLTAYASEGYQIQFDMYGYIANWAGLGYSLGAMAIPTLNGETLEYVTIDGVITETWTTFTVEIDAYLKVLENFETNGLNPTDSCLIKRNLYYSGGKPDTTFYFTELRLVKNS